MEPIIVDLSKQEDFTKAEAPTCPHCKELIGGTLGPQGEQASAGHILVCGRCVAVSIFKPTPQGLQLRLLAKDEFDELSHDFQLQILFIRQCIKDMPKW